MPVDVSQLAAIQSLLYAKVVSNQKLLGHGPRGFQKGEKAAAILRPNHAGRQIREGAAELTKEGHVVLQLAEHVAQAAWRIWWGGPLDGVGGYAKCGGHVPDYASQSAAALFGLVPINRNRPSSQGRHTTLNLFSSCPRYPCCITWRQFTREGAGGIFEFRCCPQPCRSFDEITGHINAAPLKGVRVCRQSGHTCANIRPLYRGQPAELPQFTLTYSNLLHRQGALVGRPQ